MLDWVNGCRSPHNDSTLRGVACGLSMAATPADLYRSTAMGIACGGRQIYESFTGAGVPVEGIVATGGLPHAAPELIQNFADMLQTPVSIHPSTQGASFVIILCCFLSFDAVFVLFCAVFVLFLC